MGDHTAYEWDQLEGADPRFSKTTSAKAGAFLFPVAGNILFSGTLVSLAFARAEKSSRELVRITTRASSLHCKVMERGWVVKHLTTLVNSFTSPCEFFHMLVKGVTSAALRCKAARMSLRAL